MADLCAEDELRLNVLLLNPLRAVRIDESKMIVYALTDNGEAKLHLSPTGRAEAYLREVREVLSGHVLGSPGGYPIYIRRWTRMGDITATNLKGMLLLGEPEAVVAVVRSPRLTADLARSAWWAEPNSNNARHMLSHACVVDDEIGRTLAEFLVEFLPFEENPADTIESVRLVLQPGLIDPPTREKLWRMGSRKVVLKAGFLAGSPDELPELLNDHPQSVICTESLGNSLGENHELTRKLQRVLSKQGQAYVKTALEVIKKPANQEVVTTVLNSLGDYFSLGNGLAIAHNLDRTERDLPTLLKRAESAAESLLTDDSTHQPMARAILHLAQLSEAAVIPIFAISSAVGSVMRKQIKPVTDPIRQSLETLYAP